MNFDERARYYNKSRTADYRLTQRIIELLSVSDNSVIADIGAGTGNYSLELVKHNLFVYAVEPSKEMIKQCKNEGVVFVNSYAEKIDMPNSIVDGVIVINALHHFIDLHIFTKV